MICMCIVIVTRHIIQTTELVSQYPSYKLSAKVNLLNPENSNLFSRGLGGRLGVRYIHIVLDQVGDPHSSPECSSILPPHYIPLTET